MSRLVDERIVEMSFDNRDFEKHTKESMQTIDELKEKMDFSGVAESMNDSFDSVDTSVLAKGLEKVSDGFSTLEIAAISAISNITNRLINLGTNLVKSLSIDNITAGWQKYADTTVSVGTLISQGFDMETVTDQLEKLQFFTDETSYTFTDMVSNIGKFTAAGQDLDTSVEAMMGIANWAALSGQNATTASRAMYQLSQAMGAGVVRLQDYRSIQSANMDTVEFRQTVLDTAKDIGILTESIDGMYQTSSGKRFNIDQFTEYLSEGWFTSDVLVKSLNKYSSAVDAIYERVQETGETASEAIENLSDQLDEFGLKAFKASQEARTFEDVLNSVKEAAASGFSNIFQSFFGDYEQAKVLWTDLANELYDLFIEPINLISEAFKIWKDEGRDLLFANTDEATGAFWDIYYAISDIVNLFRGSFLKVFNIDTAEKLADKFLEITKSIKSFTSQLVITEDISEKLTNIFTGFASIVKTVFTTISGFLKSLKPAFKFVFNTIKKVIDILSDVGKEISDFLSKATFFDDIQKFISDLLKDILDLVNSLQILDKVRDRIKRFFDLFKENGGTVENVKRIVQDIFKVITTIKDAAIALIDAFVKYVYPVIEPILDIVLDAIPVVLGTVVKWIADLSDFLLGLFGVAKNGGSFTDMINYISEAFGNIGNVVSKFFEKLKTLLTKERLQSLEEMLMSLGNVLLDLFGLLKHLLPIISSIINFLGDHLDKVAKRLDGMFTDNALGAYLIEWLIKIAIAIAIITSLKWQADSVRSALAPIKYILESVADMADSVAQMNYTRAMQNLALAILMIVAGIVLLASIDKDKLIPAAIVMGIIMAAMFGLLVYMKNMVQGIKSIGDFTEINKSIRNIYKLAGAMILMAVAMTLATIPLVILAQKPWDAMLIGLLGYASVIGAMVLLAKVVAKNINFGDAAKTAIVISLLSVSMLLAITPLLALAKLDWDSLWVAVAGLGIAIGVISLTALIFSALGQLAKEIAIGSAAVALVSVTLLLTAIAFKQIGVALLECTKPFKELAKMSWEDIGKATVGMLAITLMLSVLSAVSPLIGIGLLSALGLYAFGVALLVFIEPMKQLAKVDWDKLMKSFWSMLGFITVLSLVSILFGTLASIGIIALSASLILLGTALLALAGGLVPFALALLSCTKPFKEMAKMSWSDIAKALVGFMTVALIIVGLSALAPLLALGLTSALSLYTFSLALLMFIQPMKEIIKIPWDRVSNAFKSMLGSLLILSLIGIFLGTLAGLGLTALAGSLSLLGTSLLVLSAGIIPFAGALLELEKIKTEQILSIVGKMILIALGLSVVSVVMAPAIAILGVMAILLGPLILVITALITAVTGLLGALAALFGLFGTLSGSNIQNGIQSIIEGLEKALPALIRVINAILKEVNVSIKDAIKNIFQGIYEFIMEKINGRSAIFGTILGDLLTLFDYLWPRILKSLIQSGYGTLLKLIPDFVDKLIEFATNLFNTLTARIPDLIEAARNFLDELLYQLAYETVSLMPRAIRIIFNGFADGIKDEFNRWREESTGPFRLFLDWLADDVFKINSPSKVMKEMGEYVTDGFIIGVLEDKHRVHNAAQDLGDQIDEGLNDSKMDSAIFTFMSLLNGEFDETVVITPILDLTEIQNGRDSLYSMLGAGEYGISGSSTYVTDALSNLVLNRSNLGDSLTKQTATSQTPQETVINNTFNVTGDNPEEIAEEISRILQLQVDRRNAKWAT